MKKILIKPVIFSLCLNMILGSFLMGDYALGSIELVKSADFDTIYYIDSQNVRHPFPNLTVYQSWYGNDFSQVINVSSDFLARYPLGKNITVRPAGNLVKVRTSPEVYAVEPGGVLRKIKDEQLAKDIYGKNWAKIVIDVPDVFFSNYVIGKPLDYNYPLPDGILFQDKNTGDYYYKNQGILQPFASKSVVQENGFNLDDALSAGLGYLYRTRPIVGLNKNVFNPVESMAVDARDCENKKLKAAVIFAVSSDYSLDQINELEQIKNQFPDRFLWATDGLAEIDFSYPTIIMPDDGYLLSKANDGTIDIENEIINTFYDSHPDTFDFIFIWSNFKTPSDNTNELAHFTFTGNLQQGIGRNPINGSGIYGSAGKLKGIIVMGNINKYDINTSDGLNELNDLMLHEVMHQWSAYIGFIDDDNQLSFDLLRQPDYQHWSYYASIISPLGGSGWIDNGDGTFTSQLSQMSDPHLRPYSQLDLYLMGLIPAKYVNPIMYIEPDFAGAVGNRIFGRAKYVKIDQIIRANGQIECSQKD